MRHLRILTAFAFVAALAACKHKPEMTPAQVAVEDMTQFQAEIRKTVKDSARAEQLVGMTNEFQQLVTSAAANDSAAVAAVEALNADFSATRAQYESELTRARAGRRDNLKKLSDLRARMAAIVTDDEWAQLKKARVKVMDAQMNALSL